MTITEEFKSLLSERHNITDAYMNADNNCLNVLAKDRKTLLNVAIDLGYASMIKISENEPNPFCDDHIMTFTRKS